MPARKRVDYGTPQPQPQSRLLSIAPELRNRIYHNVLVLGPIPRPGREHLVPLIPSEEASEGKFSVLALLEVCRQIHDEARGLFYYFDYLYLDDINVIPCLAALPKDRAASLRILTLEVTNAEILMHAFKSLRHATGLKDLRIEAVLYASDFPGHEIRTECQVICKRVDYIRSVEKLTFRVHEGDWDTPSRASFAEGLRAWKELEAAIRKALEKSKARARRIEYGFPCSQSQSHLLSLTPELRNRIYHELFNFDSSGPSERRVDFKQSRTKSSQPGPSVLSILQTCRQVLDEAEALFYHLNHLSLNPYDAAGRTYRSFPTRFLQSLGPRRFSYIRTLTVKVHKFKDITAVLKNLRGACGSQTLTFRWGRTTSNFARYYFERERGAMRAALRKLKRWRSLEELNVVMDNAGVRGEVLEELNMWQSWMRRQIPAGKA